MRVCVVVSCLMVLNCLFVPQFVRLDVHCCVHVFVDSFVCVCVCLRVGPCCCSFGLFSGPFGVSFVWFVWCFVWCIFW